MGENSQSWSTGSEINFVSGLGTGEFAKQGDRPIRGYSCDRLEFLRRYRKSCEQRKNWDKIEDLEAVLKHTDALIGAISKGAVKE